jgi:hypothetical protein
VNYNAKFDQMVGSKRTLRRLPSSLPATTRRPVNRVRSARPDLISRSEVSSLAPRATRRSSGAHHLASNNSWTDRIQTAFWWVMFIAGLTLIGVAFLGA